MSHTHARLKRDRALPEKVGWPWRWGVVNEESCSLAHAMSGFAISNNVYLAVAVFTVSMVAGCILIRILICLLKLVSTFFLERIKLLTRTLGLSLTPQERTVLHDKLGRRHSKLAGSNDKGISFTLVHRVISSLCDST